ncbi:MAG TPA: glucuronate isomerase, partial [Candidatus Paenibacillus intestinavium]|nr:glucuronate isomerase [Candidatus Paenibacillus intestinavium]
MSNFMNEHFMLSNETAKQLYHNAAKNAPIFDFHCHLDAQEVWENKSYRNMTELWLAGDHYKWRAMRMHGIGERFITGDASDWEKFQAWAQTVPYLLGNPLYHWTHLELKNYFGIEDLLSPETAEMIWNECNTKLEQEQYRARSFIEKSNVKFIGTTDDPLSDLQYHILLAEDSSFDTIIAPTFRPDGALNIDAPTFSTWVTQLEQVTGKSMTSLANFVSALKERVNYFHEHGGRASDHDIPFLIYRNVEEIEAEAIFMKRLQGSPLLEEEIISYRAYLLTELGKMYAEKQWVMQLHMGAIRNNNTKLFRQIGKDAGFDSVGESNFAEGVSKLLDGLDMHDALPRTILYNLNPKDNAVLTGMLGNFYEEGIAGKVQFGSGWWFNDHIDGMEKQMRDLANVGLLTHFVGMLTDSRSFLSYTR